jgi:hypothetical protein
VLVAVAVLVVLAVAATEHRVVVVGLIVRKH